MPNIRAFEINECNGRGGRSDQKNQRRKIHYRFLNSSDISQFINNYPKNEV